MSDATPSPAGQPSDKHHQHVVAMLAAALLMNARASQLPHAVLLDALLSAYVTELLLHPCCHESAARGLRQVAARAEQLHVEHVAAAKLAAAQAIAQAARPAA